jgi:hypothetical protein
MKVRENGLGRRFGSGDGWAEHDGRVGQDGGPGV